MGGMGGPNMSSMAGPGPMGGNPNISGGQSQPQMNGSTASAIHALPASLPGQSSASLLTQKLATTQDKDARRTMLGEFIRPVSQVLQATTEKFLAVSCRSIQGQVLAGFVIPVLLLGLILAYDCMQCHVAHKTALHLGVSLHYWQSLWHVWLCTQIAGM